MWLLHFLPDSFLQFVVHAVLIAGLLGTAIFYFLLGKISIPFIGQYIRIGKIVSIILLVSGLYFEGGYSNEMQWRERVREMEAKVAKAEEQSNNLNDQLDELAKKKNQVIKGRTEYITRYIESNVGKHDNKFSKEGVCAIPQEFVEAHNKAAKKPEVQK